MKTDSFFYRFFRAFPEAFFILIGLDKRKAQGYQFTSVEVKDIAFRFDGIFLPAAIDDLIYYVEAQFYKAGDFYPRFFGKIFAHLEQYAPANDWRAIVIYPHEAFDTGIHPHYRELFESGRLKRIYLTDLPEAALERFPLNLLKIIIDSKEKVLSTAETIVRQLPEQVQDKKTQEIVIELLFNLLLSKLPQLSREEIKKMFEPMLSDIKKTRFYQEVAEEISQELTPRITQELTPRITQESKQEEKREIAKTLLKKNFSLDLIVEITGLSQEEILMLHSESLEKFA